MKNEITVVSLFASCCCFIQEASHSFRKKRNQLFGTTDNLLTYFEWADADEEVVMCLLKKVSVIVAGVCCLNERFFVVSCLSTRKRKRIQNNVGNKVHLWWNTDETLWRNVIHPHLLQVDYIKDLLFPPQCSFSSPSQHSLGILSSLLPFPRNIPSTRRSLTITDLLLGLVALPLYATYWMSLVQEHWSLCRYAFNAAYITGSVLFLVPLMTMRAISVDRHLALLLGLRYKQIVTLKRTYIIVATIWILSLVSSLCALLDDRITFLYRLITIPLCLVISLASYTKIFRTLRYHQVQADPV